MQEKSIINVLRYLRAQIIRDGGEGLEHVEALLRLRGDNLAPVPRKNNQRFKHGKLRLAIRAALRDRPLTGSEIVRKVCATHGPDYSRTLYVSVYMQMGHTEARWTPGP